MEGDLTKAMSDTLLALASNLSLKNSIAGLSTCDGSNIPLKVFLQDVKNGDVSVEDGQKPSYLRTVLVKFRGPAEDCTYSKRAVKELCTHLKQRFAPGRGFA